MHQSKHRGGIFALDCDRGIQPLFTTIPKSLIPSRLLHNLQKQISKKLEQYIQQNMAPHALSLGTPGLARCNGAFLTVPDSAWRGDRVLRLTYTYAIRQCLCSSAFNPALLTLSHTHACLGCAFPCMLARLCLYACMTSRCDRIAPLSCSVCEANTGNGRFAYINT